MNRVFKFLLPCILILSFCFDSFAAKPKGNSVEVVVSARGQNEEDARHQCFRSALEQVCGAFVSSGTLMTDDDISYDEIVSYSSGSIASYKILSSIPQASGEIYMTMSVVIGVTEFSDMIKKDKPAGIVSYSFDPSNIRDLYLLNAQIKAMQAENETKVLRQMIDEISYMAALCYEYKSFEARQVVNNAKTKLKYIITASVGPNDALKRVDQLIFSTLDAITKLNLKALKEEDEGKWVEAKLNMPKYVGLSPKTVCNVYLVANDYIKVIQEVNAILGKTLSSTFVIEDTLCKIKNLNNHWVANEDLSYLITGMQYSYDYIEDIATSVKHNFTPSEKRL